MINAVQGCKGDGVLTHTDGTDMLALKRERGRDAQNSKKIDLEKYKDLKVWKYLSASSEAEIIQIYSKSNKLIGLEKNRKNTFRCL